MSGAERTPSPGGEPAGGHAYFKTIEAVFIDLRGSPLLLSPKDYQLARRWHGKGIPLPLVERTLRQLFARRQAEGKADKVNGLTYCAQAVAAAWRSEQKLQAAADTVETPALEVGSRLARLAAALPAGFDGGALAARIEVLAGDAEGVESALQALDEAMLARAEADLPAADREALEHQLNASLATLGDRLPAEEVARARARLRQQLLRRRAGLPLLSLFAPEAEP